VDVLKGIHRWLRRDGLLLDVHPEPEPPLVAVTFSGPRDVDLGRIDTSGVIANIHRARAALKSLVEGGWFEEERSTTFDFVSHFASVDDWLRHRTERRSSSLVDPAIIDRARELFTAPTARELLDVGLSHCERQSPRSTSGIRRPKRVARTRSWTQSATVLVTLSMPSREQLPNPHRTRCRRLPRPVHRMGCLAWIAPGLPAVGA
jgi:hypothetical protein